LALVEIGAEVSVSLKRTVLTFVSKMLVLASSTKMVNSRENVRLRPPSHQAQFDACDGSSKC
jgi:hypothetical protein